RGGIAGRIDAVELNAKAAIAGDQVGGSETANAGAPGDAADGVSGRTIVNKDAVAAIAEIDVSGAHFGGAADVGADEVSFDQRSGRGKKRTGTAGRAEATVDSDAVAGVAGDEVS